MTGRISHYPRRDGKLPDGAKWVGRPSRYGNPYKVTEGLPAADAVTLYRTWLDAKLLADEHFLEPLADASTLACSCPIGQPCHADVLAEVLSSGAKQ